MVDNLYKGEIDVNREQFIDQLGKASTSINKDWMMNVISKTIDFNLTDGNSRGHKNLIIMMEEMAELSKEISKELRGKGDNINILEELADVKLGIYYVQEICKISDEDLHKAMNVKIKRLEDVIQEKGVYE